MQKSPKPPEASQLTTRRIGAAPWQLETRIETTPLRDLKPDEVLIEVLCVPLHGSFWLATDPRAIHPRREEFLADGSFVFGNGGVGRAVEVGPGVVGVAPGDYVAVFGHSPCDRYDCYACHTLHRYTECDYGEGQILGHGKGANDGTLASHAILPQESLEICFKADESPTADELAPFMFAFLVADVRNALTRNKDTLHLRRALIFGAGHSGAIATWLHTHSCPGSRIVVVDADEDRARRISEIDGGAIDAHVLAPAVVDLLECSADGLKSLPELQDEILRLRERMEIHFQGRRCNLLMDCSSGNTIPIWDNSKLLSPGTHCLPFGFGSKALELTSDLLQCSGMNIVMSRGVGNQRNRRETIDLIKSGGHDFISEHLLSPCREAGSLQELSDIVEAEYESRPAAVDRPHLILNRIASATPG